MSAYGTTLNTYTITSDQRPGVIALATISTISTSCVSLLLLSLFIVTFVSRREGNRDERTFLRTHIGALVVCLFLSDLIQGISGMVTLVWAKTGLVFTGSLCMTQAVMLHIGDVGTAYWNAVIAIHTFWTVVLGKRTTTVGIASLIAVGWTMCFVLTIIGPFAIQNKENGPFYAIAGAWCFITTNYKNARILLHYLPMLISATIITILYIHVALVLFGILAVDGGAWRLKAPTRKSGSSIRGFFGQFSWGRLHRSSAPAADQVIDIQGHIDTTSTGVSDGSLDRGRKSKSKPVGKQPATHEMSVFDNGPSSRPVRLKKLAIKMLWYPSAYMLLILPMAITRISPSVNISLDVVLGFTCMLLFMGTANTLIYLFTRRLGPTPWSRRARNLSISTFRSRNKVERGQAGTLSLGDISMQIQVDRYTQPAIDDHSTDLARQKSTASGLTDASSISTFPPVVCGDNGDLTRGQRDGKIRFDLSEGTATRHVLRPNSPSGPNAAFGAPELLVPYLEHQEQHSPLALSPPKPRARQQEQEQPEEQAHPGRHPYSYA